MRIQVSEARGKEMVVYFVLTFHLSSPVSSRTVTRHCVGIPGCLRNETVISGMGELHLEVYCERMRREFKAPATHFVTSLNISKFALHMGE